MQKEGFPRLGKQSEHLYWLLDHQPAVLLAGGAKEMDPGDTSLRARTKRGRNHRKTGRFNSAGRAGWGQAIWLTKNMPGEQRLPKDKSN